MDLEYSVFLTMKTLFQIELPASWPKQISMPPRRKPSPQHISTDSSSASYSSHSSYIPHGSVSPRRIQFFETPLHPRPEINLDDIPFVPGIAEAIAQDSGKRKNPILKTPCSEVVIANS